MKTMKINELALIDESPQFVPTTGCVKYFDTSTVVRGKIGAPQVIDMDSTPLPSRARKTVRQDSVIYSTVRPAQEHHAFVSGKGILNNSVFSTAFTIIEPNLEKIDPYYLYLLLTQPAVLRKLTQIANTSTSSYPSITSGDIGMLKVPVIEDIVEQSTIAAVIQNIDLLRKENEATIETLEAIIKHLSDYWLVQFDFPDKDGKPYYSNGGKMIFSTSINARVPVHWEVGSLDDIASIVTEGFNPTAHGNQIVEHYSIPAFDDGVYPAFEPASNLGSGKYLVPKDSFLYSKLNPQFKRLWDPYCITDFSVCSTEFMPYVSKSVQHRSLLFATLNSERFRLKTIAISSSSTGSRKRLTPEHTLSFPVVVPDENTIKAFNIVCAPALEAIKNYRLQNHKLAELRDWLLPMLMNGQVKVMPTKG